MARLVDQVHGHDPIKQRFQSSLEQKRLPHAFLFAGPQGQGKKALAWAFSQELVCEKGPPACGQCGSCIRVEKRQHESVHPIEPEGLNIKVDSIRDLLQRLSFKNVSRARTVIVDFADKLNPQAANTLLKTLEEPPPDTYFFLITSQKDSVLSTLRSRCQTVLFGGLSLKERSEIHQMPGWMTWISTSEPLPRETLEDLREACVTLLESLPKIPSAALATICKEKMFALVSAEILQQLVRDLQCFHSPHAELFHSDLKSRLEPLVKKLDWGRFFQNLLLMTRDLWQNGDRMLSYENLCLRSAHVD